MIQIINPKPQEQTVPIENADFENCITVLVYGKEVYILTGYNHRTSTACVAFYRGYSNGFCCASKSNEITVEKALDGEECKVYQFQNWKELAEAIIKYDWN